MSRSSYFLLAGFTKKKSSSVARKKTKDSSNKSSVSYAPRERWVTPQTPGMQMSADIFAGKAGL